jgi:septal ring factor EnvC (AmiA/AmiB activator)
MALRIALGLFVGLAMLGVVACSDDDDSGGTGSTSTGSTGGNATASGSPPASQPDYCDELDQVKTDVDNLENAARSLNRDGAQTAVNDLKADIQDFRDEVRASGEDNDALNQAIGDLSGAVDGLETTLRQATQGETSLTGVVQELAIQVPVIVTSMNEVRQEARCN